MAKDVEKTGMRSSLEQKAVAEIIGKDLRDEANGPSAEEIEAVEEAGIVFDIPEYSDAETKRILRKIDYRLVPLLTIMYIISFIDRSNSKFPNIEFDNY